MVWDLLRLFDNLKDAAMTKRTKDDRCWPIHFKITSKIVNISGWETVQWQVSDLYLLDDLNDPKNAFHTLPLELFLDERDEYRLNLLSHPPKLFFIFDITEDDSLTPIKLTACQSVAASYMDGEAIVHSVTMPVAVQVWMEAFFARHGEAPAPERKKKSSGDKRGANE